MANTSIIQLSILIEQGCTYKYLGIRFYRHKLDLHLLIWLDNYVLNLLRLWKPICVEKKGKCPFNVPNSAYHSGHVLNLQMGIAGTVTNIHYYNILAIYIGTLSRFNSYSLRWRPEMALVVYEGIFYCPGHGFFETACKIHLSCYNQFYLASDFVANFELVHNRTIV